MHGAQTHIHTLKKKKKKKDASRISLGVVKLTAGMQYCDWVPHNLTEKQEGC